MLFKTFNLFSIFLCTISRTLLANLSMPIITNLVMSMKFTNITSFGIMSLGEELFVVIYLCAEVFVEWAFFSVAFIVKWPDPFSYCIRIHYSIILLFLEIIYN